MVEWDRRDLVCLHLAAHDDARTESPVPPVLAASGIGDALAVGDSAAGRLRVLDDLAGLEAAGLVEADQRPVAGYEEPRTVYVLTEAGREHAASVREAALEETVVVTNGITEEVPLAEIDRYFEDDPAPLVAALARLTDDGRVPVDHTVSEAFVNREAPLATVRQAIAESFNRDSRTVVVGGAAGMGKTALVREAIDRIAADREALVAATGASPAGATDPYTAFRQAFEVIPDGGDLRARLEAAGSSFTPEDPEQVAAQRTALFNDIADGLRTAASDRPIVLFLDNLHWADEATLALFAHLATTVDELLYPVAFVGTYRTPAVAAGDHPLAAVLERIERAGAYRDVTLGPLGWADTRALLSSTLGRQQLPDAFVDLVHERTGGNPLFVRETATHLLETGQVDPDGERYPTDPAAIELPEEVTDQIDRRLERLDEPSRALLRLGAVLGERIPRAVLAAATALPPADHREYVDVLVASQVWTPVGSEAAAGDGARDTETGGGRTEGANADGGDLRFVSGALREAVVDRLPEDLAREYHGRVAEAFTTVSDDADAVAARIAHHYEQAGDAAPAIDHYRRAGDRAHAAYANEDAVAHYERALAVGEAADGIENARLATIHGDVADVYERVGDHDEAIEATEAGLAVAPPDSRVRCRLLGIAAGAHRKQGAYDDARDAAERQRALAADLDAGALEGEALDHLGRVAMEQGDYDRARDWFERSHAAARDAGDLEGVATSLKNLGTVAFNRSDYDEARKYYRRGLDIATDLDARHLEAACLNNLGGIAGEQDAYDRAREYFERSLAIKRDRGDRQGEATGLNNLGIIAHKQGDYDRAREYHEESLATKRDLGDRLGETQSLTNLGIIAHKQGDYDRAREYHERCLAIARDIGYRNGEASGLSSLGALAQEFGAYGRAREYLERSLAINRDLGNRSGEAYSLASLGSVAADEGAYDDAREYLHRSLDVHRELGDPTGNATVLADLGSVARQRGDLDRASEYLDRAQALFEGVGDRAGGARTRLIGSRVALDRDDLALARDRATRAREAYRDLGETPKVARSRRQLGRIAAAEGDTEGAREHWREALETFVDVGLTPDALETLEHLVETCRGADDDEQAREWVRQAEDLLADAPDPTAAQHREWVERHADELGVE